MNPQVNWQKIRNELQRFTDVDKLKTEVHRIGKELRKLDFHSVLSPAAQTKVKTFEKRYADLMRTIHQAQRQMDREFNRILRQIQVHRNDVSKVVNEQKEKLEQVSADLQKRFAGSGGRAPVAKAPRRTAAARTTKKTKTVTRKTRKGRKA